MWISSMRPQGKCRRERGDTEELRRPHSARCCRLGWNDRRDVDLASSRSSVGRGRDVSFLRPVVFVHDHRTAREEAVRILTVAGADVNFEDPVGKRAVLEKATMGWAQTPRE